MNKRERSVRASYAAIYYSWLGIIITTVMIMLTSCSTSHLPVAVISEDGTNWYSTKEGTSLKYNSKRVIAKDKDDYGYYLIALEDGSTYYCTFGQYSLIEIGDNVMFNKRMTKIININK